MKLSIWAFLLSSLIILPFPSCKTTKKTFEGGSLSDALLWQIDVPGAKLPSYVYGTIHMIEGSDYFLPAGTLSAIDKSKKMVFEIDMAEMSDMSNMFSIMNKIMMKDNKTLKSLLSDEDYKFVQSYFTEAGLPLMMLERIKPMFLAALVQGDMKPDDMQSGKLKSYEMEFFEMATSKKLATGGLETIEFQLSVFDAIPYEDQAKMLIDALKSSDSGNDEFKLMVEMYKGQKINDMAAMISDEGSGYSEYEDILLTKRNENWIPNIIKTSKEQPTFFAVGAGHLAGKNGVLMLLKKEGVKITPLSIKK